MTYLYQPAESNVGSDPGPYLRPAATLPLRQQAAIQPLLTSTNERLAGRDGILGDEVKGLGHDRASSMGRLGARSAGSMSGSLGGLPGMGSLGGM